MDHCCYPLVGWLYKSATANGAGRHSSTADGNRIRYDSTTHGHDGDRWTGRRL